MNLTEAANSNTAIVDILDGTYSEFNHKRNQWETVTWGALLGNSDATFEDVEIHLEDKGVAYVTRDQISS